MAKEEYQGMDEEELDEDELEELESTQKKAKSSVPAKNSNAVRTNNAQRQNYSGGIGQKDSPEVRKRFAIFTQPQRVGVIDTESSEVIGEGDTAVLDILADILERLERMELNIGVMVKE